MEARDQAYALEGKAPTPSPSGPERETRSPEHETGSGTFDIGKWFADIFSSILKLFGL